MGEQQNSETMLGGYRALDLTQGAFSICGKLMGDLGADVIKIERPGGDRTRNIGPFYKDIPDPEKSLFWFFLNLNKRSITLDIETDEGSGIFKRLVQTADFVLESFQPGYMDELGLGYGLLEDINPAIIMTSITPFGQTGPYAHYKVKDMIGTAMSGAMHYFRYLDSPPLRLTPLPQFELLGALSGAAGSMVALYYRELTGAGQHVDVSCQQIAAGNIMHGIDVWEWMKVAFRGMGPGQFAARPTGLLYTRMIFPCKDGYVYFMAGGGAQAGLVTSSKRLVEIANRDGMCLELKDLDWSQLDMGAIAQEEWDRIQNSLGDFIRTKTKQELFDEAIANDVILIPTTSIKDVVESPQFKSREFWVEVDHSELGESIAYPGFPIKWTELPPYRPQRRAPLIGEHNSDIYEAELGFSKEELVMLKVQGVI